MPITMGTFVLALELTNFKKRFKLYIPFIKEGKPKWQLLKRNP